MYWPPQWNPNNVFLLNDDWYVFATSLIARFAPQDVPATVLSPWLARTDQDTVWKPADPMLRALLLGPLPSPLPTFNNSGYGATLYLGSPALGTQVWEIVSSFDWWTASSADELGCMSWSRLLDPAPPVGPTIITGGVSCAAAVPFSIGVYYTTTIAAGTTQWFYCPSMPAVPYSRFPNSPLSGLTGKATFAVNQGTCGSNGNLNTINVDGSWSMTPTGFGFFNQYLVQITATANTIVNWIL